MNEVLGGRDRFDALHKLAEQAWRDWDHKARYQWRLAFAIWGALLAATYVKATVALNVPSWVPWVFAIVILLIHWYFLGWIEGRIRQCRRQMFQYVLDMEPMANIQSDELKEFADRLKEDKELPEKKQKAKQRHYKMFVMFHKPAAAVHLLITIVVGALFIMTVEFTHLQKEAPRQTTTKPVSSDSTAITDHTDSLADSTTK